jgi:predicted transcriptional regulator
VDVAMLMSDELGETAEKIFRFIQVNPGVHLRRIKEMIHISLGTVQYHTDRLKRNRKITSTRSGLYKHYFPIGVFQNNETTNFESGNYKTDPYAYCRAASTYSN